MCVHTAMLFLLCCYTTVWQNLVNLCIPLCVTEENIMLAFPFKMMCDFNEEQQFLQFSLMVLVKIL